MLLDAEMWWPFPSQSDYNPTLKSPFTLWTAIYKATEVPFTGVVSQNVQKFIIWYFKINSNISSNLIATELITLEIGNGPTNLGDSFRLSNLIGRSRMESHTHCPTR